MKDVGRVMWSLLTVLVYHCSSESKENQEMSLRVTGQKLKVAPPEYKCTLFTISLFVTIYSDYIALVDSTFSLNTRKLTQKDAEAIPYWHLAPC